MDVLGKRLARLLHQAFEPASEKLDRLALQLELHPLVFLKDGPRARAEGPVIQKMNAGAQERARRESSILEAARYYRTDFSRAACEKKNSSCRDSTIVSPM